MLICFPTVALNSETQCSPSEYLWNSKTFGWVEFLKTLYKSSVELHQAQHKIRLMWLDFSVSSSLSGGSWWDGGERREVTMEIVYWGYQRLTAGAVLLANGWETILQCLRHTITWGMKHLVEMLLGKEKQLQQQRQQQGAVIQPEEAAEVLPPQSWLIISNTFPSHNNLQFLKKKKKLLMNSTSHFLSIYSYVERCGASWFTVITYDKAAVNICSLTSRSFFFFLSWM